MEFFVNKYRDLLGIDVIINTTEVTSEYQTVGAEDNPTHLAMAQKYYKSGWMTAMYSNFDPNPELLLGYASKFPTELPASLADWYTIMVFIASTLVVPPFTTKLVTCSVSQRRRSEPKVPRHSQFKALISYP